MMWKPLRDQLLEEQQLSSGDHRQQGVSDRRASESQDQNPNIMNNHDAHSSFRLDEDELNDMSYANFDEGQSLGESFLDPSAVVSAGVDDSVPDIMLLNVYCARAKAPRDTEESKVEAMSSWQPVRQWLSTHTAEEVRTAAEQKGESGLTALHFACRNCPPVDVVDVFLSITDTVRRPDTFGWLPIHYATAAGSDSKVIQALAEAFPECKTTVDRRGRTPLHFALGDKPAAPDVVLLLSNSGAAACADDNGMLPLHYSCAFGSSEEVLYVLTEAYPEGINAKDKRQRTPLHFALSNAGRKTVPAAVRLLVSLNRDIVNAIDNGPVPLRVLAEYAATIKREDENREEKRESVFRCLDYLLKAEPEPTAGFLTALQSLPDWLSERAVVMPGVQILLNEKISRPFPTAVLMLDFYILIMIVVSYSMNVTKSIELRFNGDPTDHSIPGGQLVPLYLGAAYFALREIVQVMSLISLKSFHIWLYDPSNYLNVAFVFIILFWAIRMQTGSGNNDAFRIGAAVSITIVWVKFVAYLRNVMIEFAVFVGGVFYVVRRLAAFLTALCVILLAFAQMFFTVFQQTPYCKEQPNQYESTEVITYEARCNASEFRPYCNFWSSFVSVYTMLLGEVAPKTFTYSTVAVVLFVLFMFLVVILLANVLIAIVTDSYKVIQDQRAAIVFWTNRLDFVAEMDGIANGPWKSRMWKALGCGSCIKSAPTSERKAPQRGKELWKQIMDLFEDEVEEGMLSFEFLAYTLLRFVAAFFVVPLWVLSGIITVGWLWPPQVREAVFTSSVMRHSSDTEKENELRKTQVIKLQQEVQNLNDELLQELAIDRTQLVQFKSHVAERKVEISNEMRQIKRIVAALFERQSA